MTHIAPLVAVILTSSLLTCTAAEASILCTWAKVLPTGEVHYSFLRRDPRQASPALRLYHSSWSGERTLLSCAWSDDAAVTQNYFSLCRERTHEFTDHPDVNFDVHSMFEAEDLCVTAASPGVGGERTGKRPVRSVDGLSGSLHENQQGQVERSEVRTHQRVKRGFIVPGTLWCGSGNKAPSYADLGTLVSNFTRSEIIYKEVVFKVKLEGQRAIKRNTTQKYTNILLFTCETLESKTPVTDFTPK